VGTNEGAVENRGPGGVFFVSGLGAWTGGTRPPALSPREGTSFKVRGGPGLPGIQNGLRRGRGPKAGARFLGYPARAGSPGRVIPNIVQENLFTPPQGRGTCYLAANQKTAKSQGAAGDQPRPGGVGGGTRAREFKGVPEVPVLGLGTRGKNKRKTDGSDRG